jgi:fimbrial chaperone protein
MTVAMRAALRATAKFCLAVAILARAPAAQAGALSVEPLRLELDPAARATAITVRNDEPTPVVIQARVLAWSQPDGKDRLEETRDFLVTPAIVEIPAKGFQVLRLGRRAGARGPAEATYRVLLKEILPDAPAGSVGVRMAMELSLPLFVSAPGATPARLAWTAEVGPDSVRMTAHNAGGQRARLSSAELLDAQGRSVGRWSGVTYLLAGATRSFRFRSDATLTAGSPVTLLLATESGKEEVRATLVGMGP